MPEFKVIFIGHLAQSLQRTFLPNQLGMAQGHSRGLYLRVGRWITFFFFLLIWDQICSMPPSPRGEISTPKAIAVWIIYPSSHGHEPSACYLFGVKWSLYHVQFGLFYRFNPYFTNLKLQQPCNFNKSIMQMNKNTENFVNPFNSICTCLFKSRHGRDSTDPWTGWTHSYDP